MPAMIEIDVHGRWEAVALMRRLDPFRSYLIQLAPDRWLVRAEAHRGESLRTALAAIDESLAARRVTGASVRVDGESCSDPAGARSWGGRPIGADDGPGHRDRHAAE
jgi:hypothetical protein